MKTANDIGLTFSDLSVTELVCDCGLRWLAEATAAKRVRVTVGTKCFRPREFNGTQFKKLQPENFQCRKFMRLPSPRGTHSAGTEGRTSLGSPCRIEDCVDVDACRHVHVV